MAIADLRCTTCYAPIRPERTSAGIHRCAYCGTSVKVSGLGGAILAQADLANPRMPGFNVLIDTEARWVPGPPPQLVAQLPGEKKGWNLLVSQATYDDFDVSASVRLLHGDAKTTEANLKLRRSAKGFYEFSINTRGSYSLHFLRTGGGYEKIVGWTQSAAVRTTPGDVNEMRVICDGDRLRGLVNGTQVLSLRDGSASFGTIGIGASSEVPMAVAVVALVIRDIERDAPARAAPAAGDVAEVFDVILVTPAPGPVKIQSIKVVREATNLGLKESKDLVEAPRQTLLRQATRDRAQKLHDELRHLGCDVELRRSS